jgi:hypothetical protein
VERVDDRFIVVSATTAGRGDPWYRRRFDKRETSDIRVYLHGGDDRAVVAGPGGAGTMVRLIGGGGDDQFADSSRVGGARFYDDRGSNSAVGGRINDRPYEAIDDPDDPVALPHRDWGRKALSFPFAAVGPDAGVKVGWGGRFTRFGFRKKPWSSRLTYSALIATGANTGRLAVNYRIMRENSRSFLSIDALGSGIEVLRWHGFGNGTSIDPNESAAFYRATQHQVLLTPSFGWALGERSTLRFGPRFKYSVTELDDGKNAARFIGTDRPFGASAFAQLGFGAELEVDTRDVELAARRGVHLEVAARFHPSVLDVTHSFGSLSARASTYLTASMPATPTLALQAGGTRIFGTAGSIPFHEAAFLGSGSTLRGFRSNRFAGDKGALWGSAELRLTLSSLFILVPGRQGVFGFYDVGRVYHRGDPVSADAWHDSFGGGLWMSFLTRGSMLSVAVGHGDEGNRLHARVGFGF